MAFRCLNLPLYKTIKGVDKRGGASSPAALEIEKVSTRLGALLRPTPGGGSLLERCTLHPSSHWGILADGSGGGDSAGFRA